MSSKYLTFVLVLLTLLLGGCGQEDSREQLESEASALDAAETVVAQAEALREGDLLRFVRLAVPPEQYRQMAESWPKRVKEAPATAEEKREFAEAMAKFTADGAEEKLFAELEPQLARAEAELAAQLPLMVGMGRAFVVQAIQQSKQLSAEQKQQAVQFVDAFARWLESAQPFDRERARAALATMVATARKLGIQTLDQVEALDFESMLRKAGEVYVGVRDVLKLYGLDLEATLASVKAEVKSLQGDEAVVLVRYDLFGQPLSFETRMSRRDGRWYGADALREFERALREPQAEVAASGASDQAAVADQAEPEAAPATPAR